MKIRRNFVSNSSTCSFVAIGFEVPVNRKREEKILKDLYNISEEEIDKENIEDFFNDIQWEQEYQFLNSDDTNGKNIFGTEIARIDDDYGGFSEIELDLVEETNKLEKIRGEMFEINSNIKLYAGIRMC